MSDAPFIFFTRGLPASGKSSWARYMQRSFAPGTIKTVSMDDLRRTIDDGKAFEGGLTRADEDLVQGIQAEIVLASVRRGVDMIVHNTHAVTKVPQGIVARVLGAGLEARWCVVDFTDVPEKTCVTRDAQRRFRSPAEMVGPDVIHRIANTMRDGEDGFASWWIVSPAEASQILLDRHGDFVF